MGMRKTGQHALIGKQVISGVLRDCVGQPPAQNSADSQRDDRDDYGGIRKWGGG